MFICTLTRYDTCWHRHVLTCTWNAQKFPWLYSIFFLFETKKKIKHQNQASRIIQDLNGMNCTVWTLWQAADLDNSLSPDGWGLVATSYCGYEGDATPRCYRPATGSAAPHQYPLEVGSKLYLSYADVKHSGMTSQVRRWKELRMQTTPTATPRRRQSFVHLA